MSRLGGKGIRRKSTRDTITSYLSKTRRESAMSNSNSCDSKDTPPSQGSNCLMDKCHTNGTRKVSRLYLHTNGHDRSPSPAGKEQSQTLVDILPLDQNGHVANHEKEPETDGIHTTLL